jgi:hypothetical protein
MAVHKLYIQQTNFDGIDYTKGTPIDTLAKYSVVCREFPFKLFPEAKDVVSKSYKDSHGADAYIPAVNKIKDYDIEVQFLYVGVHNNMRTDIGNFIKFLNGMNGGNDQNAVGARLAIYDQYTQTGRKDIRYVTSDFGTYWDSPDCDTEAIADFKVKFHVYDPVTDVTTTTVNNQTVLTWS